MFPFRSYVPPCGREEAEHRNGASERAQIRGMRRALTEDEQHKVASCIAEHLESTNWKIEQGSRLKGTARV